MGGVQEGYIWIHSGYACRCRRKTVADSFYTVVIFERFVADDSDPEDGYSYKQMMARDERRFKMADLDNDMKANKEEFTAFLHPEEYDHMKDIVVLVSGTT